mgnify:FL=1
MKQPKTKAKAKSKVTTKRKPKVATKARVTGGAKTKRETKAKNTTMTESQTDQKIHELLEKVRAEMKKHPPKPPEPEPVDAFPDATAQLQRLSMFVNIHAGFYFIRGGKMLLDHRSMNESANGYCGPTTTFSKELSTNADGIRTILHVLKTATFSTGENVKVFCNALIALFDALLDAFKGNSILNDPISRAGDAFLRYILESFARKDDVDEPLQSSLRTELLHDCHLRLGDLALAFAHAEEHAGKSAAEYTEAIRKWEDRIDAIRHSVPECDLPVVETPFFGTSAYQAYERKIRAWYKKEEYITDPHGAIRKADAEIAKPIAPPDEDAMLRVKISQLESIVSKFPQMLSAQFQDALVAIAKALNDHSTSSIGKTIREQQRKDAAKIMRDAREKGENMSFDSAANAYISSIQDKHPNFEELAEQGGYEDFKSLSTALYKNADKLNLSEFNTGKKGRPKD